MHHHPSIHARHWIAQAPHRYRTTILLIPFLSLVVSSSVVISIELVFVAVVAVSSWNCLLLATTNKYLCPHHPSGMANPPSELYISGRSFLETIVIAVIKTRKGKALNWDIWRVETKAKGSQRRILYVARASNSNKARICYVRREVLLSS